MTTDGGRFDFEDGGAYVGGWSEGKAHGLGLVTGPRGQGEFAGLWEDGFESSGVYIWPSGNTYEGEWRHGKRHGVGVEIKGRWIYRGEWMTGFKGRYGVRESEASGARYEGTWQLGMQDGAGVETYADGSTYSGCWFHGTRHGLGVRQSVAYGLAAHYRDGGRLRESLTSLRSQDEEGAAAAAAAAAAATTGTAAGMEAKPKRLDESRGGFVMRGRPVGDPAGVQSQKTKRNSLTRSLLSKLKRQRSAGDITDQRSGRYSGSVRSTYSAQSHVTDQSSVATSADFYDEIVDPATTETYYGDWKQDKRAGLGVAERSDGLKYEGEWDGNKKHGYGATTYPDGSVEAGKYKFNMLIASTAKRSKLFIIKSSRLKERVETAVREARNARAEAVKKSENAQSRQFISKQKAELAEAAAEKSRSDAEVARKLAKEYAPDFHQPGIEFLKRRAETDVFSTITLTHSNGNRASAATGASRPGVARQRTTEELPVGSGAAPNTLNPNQMVDGTLQVGGGGSRRGSFRAVRPGSSGGGSGGGRHQAATGSGSSQAPRSSAASAGSEQLDVREVVNKLQAVPAAAAPASNRSAAAAHSLDRVEPLTRVLSNASSSDHFDQYKTALPTNSRCRQRDSGLSRGSSCEHDPSGSGGSGGHRVASGAANGQGSSRGDSDSGLSEASSGSSLMAKCRRRTMPSLLSSPPVRPAMVGPTLEDATKSVENLKESGTYIVENGIRKRVQAAPGNSRRPPEPEQALPRRYHIESQTQLAKDLGEGSLPDVTVCKRRSVMPREEASRLGEARRLELLRLEERRRQGEIIIRLADLKDWCKEHLLLVFVCLVNAALLLLFVVLLAAPSTA